MATTKVNSEFIAVNAISGTIIADGAITSTHLAANCVDSSELVTGSIDTIHIAANQVTATKIVTNGVLTRHISDDQVTGDKLTNNITIAGTLTSTGAFTSPGIDDNADAIAITIDSSENVGIGTASPSTTLDVVGDITATSTDTGSSAGPIINLVRDSSSPADADYIGQIKFKGEDDGGASTTYSKITGKIGDASNGSEDGIIEFAAQKAGSSTILARLSSTKLALLNSTELEAPVVDGENFKINGAQGSDGQLMTSTGSGVAWEDAPASGPSKGLAIVLSMIF